jgi:DNA primase
MRIQRPTEKIMAAKYVDYYTSVADRILPFLQGRQVAIEQRFPRTKGIVYRRHTGGSGDDTWIRISDRDSLLAWARQHAVGLHAHIRSEDRGAWFVIDIDSRNLPIEMAQLAAVHATNVLAEQGIDALVKFSGSDGFHLMWDVPELDSLEDDALWGLERDVVRAVACQVERRLAGDPKASLIWDTVGARKQAITTGSADRENPNALLFDEYILKDSANFRVPYSIHPTTGLVAVPLIRSQLATFRERDASPVAVAADWPVIPLPTYTVGDVQRALDAWRADGC